jgi:urease accessory protein
MARAEQVAGGQPRTVVGPGGRTAVEASLELKFERDGAARTVLVHSTQQPPLRVVRAFPGVDGSRLAHLHNVSGGLLGGDDLTLCVEVGPAAQVQITTTGATRIYRPRVDARAAVQRNRVRLARNALLEYVPDAIIPFAGSRFAQETTIELAEGAGLFWWEIVAPGREARGEVFAFESFEMRLDLFARGRPIAAERVRLVPGERAASSLCRLGAFRYWANFYICRAGLSGDWIRIEEELRRAASEFEASGPVLWGVSALPADGVVVRCLAMQGRDANGGLHSLWSAAKQLLYHRQAIRPRKLN